MSARIDWGYAKDYMEAAWSMLQQKKPSDYIIATGEAHSVKEFVDEAFNVVGLRPEDHVSTAKEFMRPTKTSTLIGDISKAKTMLNFNPSVRFKDLVKLMVESDIKEQKSFIN